MHAILADDMRWMWPVLNSTAVCYAACVWVMWLLLHSHSGYDYYKYYAWCYSVFVVTSIRVIADLKKLVNRPEKIGWARCSIDIVIKFKNY
jgi:hypothetical protein